jgi:hypothetical protein
MRKLKAKRGNIDRSDVDRAVLTDTARADLPIIFSNDGFHANLRRKPALPALGDLIDRLIRVNKERYTIPYRYRIRLSPTTSRQLSLAHPAAQFRAARFYESYAHLIPYSCRNRDVSLRRPTKVGSTVFHLTRGSGKKRYKGAAIDTLLQDHTIRNPGSFFAYSEYDRFYKFFKSREFVGLEKAFSVMRMTDISKCFSSIYSHTMAWAVKDVQHGKESTSAVTFANDFDNLMQYSNYNGTNGIPVGAELSRIFAEIILQAADGGLIRRAEQNQLHHNRDFAVRRYIDDYAIFANSADTLDALERGLVEVLGVFNLHLNNSKTQTIHRPLQTKKSQIIAQAAIGLTAFQGRVSIFDNERRVYLAAPVRRASLLLGSLVDDMKVACVNGQAGYDEVSPYIVGSIANTIETLVESFKSASKSPQFSRQNYLGAFEALLSALYFFFTVHVTVPTSYQVAKATIIAIRFFDKHMSEFSTALHELVRSLITDVIRNPALHSVNMSDCVPIEVMNIVLASSELPMTFRPTIDDIRRRVMKDDRVDYFSYISLLFYYGNSDSAFIANMEKKLVKLLPQGMPQRKSHDAHFMLDLIACPYLNMGFRSKLLSALFTSLGMSAGPAITRLLLVAEIAKNPWFVNWTQIDLLNHLRKKELSTTY